MGVEYKGINLQPFLPGHVLQEPTLEERTFLKSDVRGFTRLTDYQNSQGEAAKDKWLKLIESLAEVFAVIKQYNGAEVGKEGDAVLGAFKNTENALGAALAAQEKLAKLPKVYGPDPENPAQNCDQNLVMRIGLATGPCYLGYAESGKRRIPVFGGPVVDEAYHTEEAAPPGKVAVDYKTKAKLPYEFEARDFHGHTVWVPKTQSIQAPTAEIIQPNLQDVLKFFPEQVLDRITDTISPARYQPATIFFAELPMLHEIAEKAIAANSLQDVRAVYDAYFRVLQPAIEGHGGLVLKFYKNKVIGGFGITKATENTTARAREMKKYIEENWQEPSLLRLARKYSVDKPFLIGDIHRAESILTGVLGGENKFFDILGDDVNIAARDASGCIKAYEEQKIKAPVYVGFSKSAIKDRGVTLVTQRFAKYQAKGKGEREIFNIIEEETRKAQKLIGRDKEINIIDKTIQEFYSGTPTVLDITGEAGSGKTELTKVLMERFHGEVYSANSVEYAKDVPDRLMQTLLRSYLNGSIEKVPEDKKAIVNHWLSLGLKEYAAPALSPEALAEKRLETLVELLSGSRKLVVLNDVHWADEESLAKWQKLTQRLGNVMFVTNYRDDEIATRREYLTGTEIKLGAFDKEGTKQLIERKTGTASDELVKFVFEKSEGVPLFIEEITEYLQEKDLIQEGRLKTTEVNIPDKNGIFLSRLDQLAEQSREAKEYLINASAMYGDEWETDFFEAKPETIKLLLERGFLKQNGKIGWKHNLMRTAIYNSIRAGTERKQLHTRIGRLMETKWANSIDDHLVEVAFEYEMGDDLDKGGHYNTLIARKSTNEQKYVQALVFAKKVEKLLDQKELTLQLRLNLGYTLNAKGLSLERTGQKEEAEKAYNRALEIANALDDSEAKDDLMLRINTNLSSLYIPIPEKFTKPFEKALTLARKKNISTNRLIEGLLEGNAGRAYKGEKALQHNQNALELLKEFGDTFHLAMVYINLSEIWREKGIIQEVINSAEKARKIGTCLKHPEILGRADYSNALAYDRLDFDEQAMPFYISAERHLTESDNEIVFDMYDAWVKFCIKTNQKDLALEICNRWERKCKIAQNKAALKELEKIKKELLLLPGQNK